MKKMLRIAAALTALLAMTNFIGCKNDDDDESGNGLENTYWAMGEISTDVVENVSLTLKNGMYVHIEDSSKGSVYEADVENLDYSTLDFTKTNSVDISYSSEKQPFTYVVDGSKITVTSKYTDEDGKEQTAKFEATLAADKKSFTTKEINDGKEVLVTYTRIDKAPANATLVITVAGSDVAVTEVKITSTVTEVTAGETITLTAEVSPENATDKTVTWISSDTAIATVDSTGKVTGVAAGTAKITAKAGEKTATVAVTVKAAATSGGETGGSTGGETATPKTATIAYDGSSAENAPVATGDEGVFSSVQDMVAGADVVEEYSLDAGYPKYGSQTYKGDDGVADGTTSTGMLFVSKLQDGATKIDFAADTVMAYVTYNFTLSAKSDVEAAVKAFNTQSSALAGKIEILDSNGILKVSKQAEAGSKSANDVTTDSVELDAGAYTLKFSWVTTKAVELKKVNCGISSFSINATTK